MYLDEASVMGTENAIMASVLARGRDDRRPCRLRAAHPGSLPLPRLARRPDRGHRLEHPPHRGSRPPRRRHATASAPTTSRWRASPALAAVTGGEVTIEDVQPGRPDLDRPRLPQARDRAARWATRRCTVPAGPGPPRRGRLRRADPQDRERHLACLPGRPDLDRGHRRDAGAGHDPRLREDVRVPPVLRRQARLDGRAHHPLRSASRRRHGPDAAPRRAAREPRHPRRDGDGDRGAVAEGTSTIGNIGQIDRGYERIDERLRGLGASIERAEL